MKGPKVAIVHDWLVGGGAERVVYELHQMFPDAPIYTSYATEEWRKKLDGKVVTGRLQHFGFLRKFLQLPRLWWFAHLDLSGYDLVISSTGNGEAKDIRVPRGTPHICYCNTPTHFYWRHYDKYLKHPGFGVLDPLARVGLRLLVGPLRQRDLRASKRPDLFIANSTHIQADIKKYYGRDSVVVHPPVDVERFSNQESRIKNHARHGFVTTGRQVPLKRIDFVVAACTELGVPLKVIGRGPEHAKLVKMAGPTVTFLDNVSDTELPAHLAGAEAYLFASYEDFGIAPVEALAAGTPVIAYKAGGVLDYVKAGKTGMFFAPQTTRALIAAVKAFSLSDYATSDIKTFAQNFSREQFQKSVSEVVQRVLQ